MEFELLAEDGSTVKDKGAYLIADGGCVATPLGASQSLAPQHPLLRDNMAAISAWHATMYMS